MTQTSPPLYPFPSDEILWASVNPDDFNLDTDSYFALGELPETDVREFNGNVHENPYRLVIRTPVRGSSAMYANAADCSSLFALAMMGMARDESGMYSPQDDDSTFVFNPTYWEHMTGLSIELATDHDTDE
jgi:hypothetical protein